MFFGVINTQFLSAWFPVEYIMGLIDSVIDPVEFRVHLSGVSLYDVWI